MAKTLGSPSTTPKKEIAINGQHSVIITHIKALGVIEIAIAGGDNYKVLETLPLREFLDSLEIS